MANLTFFAAMTPGQEDLLISGIVAGGVVILAVLFGLVWGKAREAIIAKTKTKLDDFVLNATAKPLPYFIGSLGVFIAISRLVRTPDFANVYWVKLLYDISYVLLILMSAWLTFRLANSLFSWYLAEVSHKTETQLDDAFMPVLQKIVKVVIMFVAFTIILDYFQVNVTSMIAGAGVASLAIALAAKDTISNMISGFIIMLDRPFRIGDMIELANGKTGMVHEIGLRSTKIRTFDYTLLIIPNSEICNSSIINFMYPDVKFKCRMTYDVAYGTDVRKVKEMLIAICKEQPEVLADPEPTSYFMEFSSSSLKVRVDCWVPEIGQRFDVMERMRMIVKDRFEKENIEVPFQTQTLYLKKDD